MSLDDIRQRVEAAEPGPWHFRHCPPCTKRGHRDAQLWGRDGNTMIAHWGDEEPFEEADAEFIAHARTDIPFLLDERDKLRAALDAVLSVHVEGTFQRLEPQQECKHCRYAWPCVTVRAITEALR